MRCAVKSAIRRSAVRAAASVLWITFLFFTGPSSAQDKPAVPPVVAPKPADHDRRAATPPPSDAPQVEKGQTRISPERLRRYTGQYCFLPTELEPRGLGLKPTEAEKKNLDCADKILKDSYFNNAYTPASDNGNALYNLPKEDFCSLKKILALPDGFRVVPEAEKDPKVIEAKIAALVAEAAARLEKFPREQDNLALCYFFSQHRNPTEREKASNEYKFELKLEEALKEVRLNKRKGEDFASMGILPLYQTFKDRVAPKTLSCEGGAQSTAFEAFFYREHYLDTKWEEQNELWRKANPRLAQKVNQFYERRRYIPAMRYRLCDTLEKDPGMVNRLPKAVTHFSQPTGVASLWVTDALLAKADGQNTSFDTDRVITFFEDGFVADKERADVIRGIINGCPAAKAALTASLKKSFEETLLKIGPRGVNGEHEEIGSQEVWRARNQEATSPEDKTPAAEDARKIARAAAMAVANGRRAALEAFTQHALVSTNIVASMIARKFVECGGADDAQAQAFFSDFIPKLGTTKIEDMIGLFDQLSSGASADTHERVPGQLMLREKVTASATPAIPPAAPYCLFSLENEPRFFTAPATEAALKLRTKLQAIESFLFAPTMPSAVPFQPNAIERSFLWNVSGRIGLPESVPISANDRKGILGYILRTTKDTASISWDRLFEDTVFGDQMRKALFPPGRDGEYEADVEKRIRTFPFPAVAAAIVREHYLKKLEVLRADRAVGDRKAAADSEQRSFKDLRLEVCQKLRKGEPRATESFLQLKKFVGAVRSADPLNAKKDLDGERIRLFLSLDPPLRDQVNDIVHAACALKYPDFKARLFEELVGGDVAPFSSFDAKGAWVNNLNRYETLCKIVTEMENRVPASPADRQAFDAQFRNDGDMLKLLMRMDLADLQGLLTTIKASPANFGKLVISGEEVRVSSWEEKLLRPKVDIVAPASTAMQVNTLPNADVSSVYTEKAAKHLVTVYEQADALFADTKAPEAQLLARAETLFGPAWNAAYGKPLFDPKHQPSTQLTLLRAQADEARFLIATRRLGLLGMAKGGNPMGPASKELSENKEYGQRLLLIRERGRELLAATSALREELAKQNGDSTHHYHTRVNPEAMLRGIIKEQERWNPIIEEMRGAVAAGRLKAGVLREAKDAFEAAANDIEKLLTKHITGKKPLPGPLSFPEFDSLNLQFPRGKSAREMGFQLINIPLSTISLHGKLSDAVFDHMNRQASCGADAIMNYTSPGNALGYFESDTKYLYNGERDEEKRKRLPQWICWAATICAPLGGEENVKRMEMCRLGAPAVEAIRNYIDKQAEVFTRVNIKPEDDEAKRSRKNRASDLIRQFINLKMSGSDRGQILIDLDKLKRSNKAEDRELFSMVASVILQLPSSLGSDLFLSQLMAPSRFLWALESREAEWRAEEEAASRARWAETARLRDVRDLNDPRRVFTDPFNLDRRGRLGFGNFEEPSFGGRLRLPASGTGFPLVGTPGENPLVLSGGKPSVVAPRLKLRRGDDGGVLFEGGNDFQPLTPEQLNNLLGGATQNPHLVGPQLPPALTGRTRFVIPSDWPDQDVKPADSEVRLLPVILRGPDGKLLTLPRRRPNGDPLRIVGAEEIDPSLLVPLEVGNPVVFPADRVRLGRSGMRWDPNTLMLDEFTRELPLTHEEVAEFRELLRQAPSAWLQHHWARDLANVPSTKTMRQELADLRDAVMVARTAVDNTPVPNIPETAPKTPELAELEKMHVTFLSKIVNELYDAKRGDKFDFAKVNALKLPMADLEEKFKRAELLGGEWLVLHEVRNLIEDQRAYLRIAVRSNHRAPICFHRMFSTLSNAPDTNNGYTCIDINAMTPALMKSAEELEKVLALVSDKIKAQLTRGEAMVGRSGPEFTDFVRTMVGPEQELIAREQRILGGGETSNDVARYGNAWVNPKSRQNLSTIPRHDIIDYNSMWKSNLDFARMPDWTKYRFVKPEGNSTIPDKYMVGRIDVTGVTAEDRNYYTSAGAYGPWASRLNEELSRAEVARAIREALVKKGDFMHMLNTRSEGSSKWMDGGIL